MQSRTFSVNGMSCSACANRVERTVKELPGIGQASVDFTSKELFVEYDENRLQLEDIKQSVKKIGYGVR